MKKCLILANSFKTEAPLIGSEMENFLYERGVDSTVFSYDGKEAREKQVDVDFHGYDFVVTLGGDGTVLFACRNCAPMGIPVFPINLGEFGFLAGVQKNSWKKELSDFLEDRCPIGERYLVEAEILHEGKTVASICGMNDVIISGISSSRLINLNVAYNKAMLGPFKATGLIISTATGSTAYSAAAGGPIIDPSLDALVLTPISSFSLSARPLVFGSKGELAIKVMPSRTEVGLTVDGQDNYNLYQGDVVILGISKYKARIACATQENFYSALQSKLNWSGGPRA